MTVLTAQQRAKVSRWWQRENTTTVDFTKPDLAAGIAAIDDWLEANQTSFNQALPQPFRGQATTAQKLDLLMYVLQARAAKLHPLDEDGGA